MEYFSEILSAFKRPADLMVSKSPYCCLGLVAVNIRRLCQVTRKSHQQRDVGTSRNQWRQVAGVHRAQIDVASAQIRNGGNSMNVDVRPVLQSPRACWIFVAAF